MLDPVLFQTPMPFRFRFFGRSMGFKVDCLKTYQEVIVLSYEDSLLTYGSSFAKIYYGVSEMGIALIRIWKNLNMFTFQGIFGVLKSSRFLTARQDNGSVWNEKVFAVTEGLVCDHNGGWIIGFSRYLGSYRVMDVEF
ncbi:hypothetical protein Gotur_034824 [Gossypium turneri]